MRDGSDPFLAWADGARVAALQVLPASGAIVEANDHARALFPDAALLEMELARLLDVPATELTDALQMAWHGSCPTLPVTLAEQPWSLLCTASARRQERVLVALLPRALPAPSPRRVADPTASAFPPLRLAPGETGTGILAELRTLLEKICTRWPVAAAAIFQRTGLRLRLLLAHGDAGWEKLSLSPMQISTLLQDGEPLVLDKVGEPSLHLQPLYLPGTEEPWGALALRPVAEAPAHDQAAAAEHAAHLLGSLLALGQAQSRTRAARDQATQQKALRNAVLARWRRGALLLDPAGALVAINEVASVLLDWPAEDVTGRPLHALLTDMGPFASKLSAMLDSHEAVGPTTSRLQRPGKLPVELSLSLLPIEGAAGYRLIMLEDHENARAYGETQHHLDRLAVLGKMSAMIAHDLRNPLASILYGIEMLAEGLGEEHPEQEQIALLMQEGERVHRIIEDVLSMSRQPSLTISLCSLRALMDQVHDTHQRQLQKKAVHVRRYYEPSLPLIEGDPVRLGQMLGNLFGNALEAVSEGGQIEVVLRPLTLDQIIARGLNPDQEERLAGGVEVLLRDNGPGIPESQHEQIFEPLFTTKHGGTGLGLAIVRTIVEQHRGLIFLDSEPGKGTTFQIFLPQLGVTYRERV